METGAEFIGGWGGGGGGGVWFHEPLLLRVWERRSLEFRVYPSGLKFPVVLRLTHQGLGFALRTHDM